MTDFLVIGPVNAVHYDSVFPFMCSGKIRFGVEFSRCHIFFKYGDKEIDVSGVCFYTSLSNDRNKRWDVTEKFDENKYKKFDNIDAINIDDCRLIPDYDGIMGVPLGFFRKYDPNQFKVLCMLKDKRVEVDGKSKYVRILIRKK